MELLGLLIAQAPPRRRARRRARAGQKHAVSIWARTVRQQPPAGRRAWPVHETVSARQQVTLRRAEQRQRQRRTAPRRKRAKQMQAGRMRRRQGRAWAQLLSSLQASLQKPQSWPGRAAWSSWCSACAHLQARALHRCLDSRAASATSGFFTFCYVKICTQNSACSTHKTQDCMLCLAHLT